jgi:hypothetical protein
MTKWTWNDAMRKRIRANLDAVASGEGTGYEPVRLPDLRAAFIEEGVSMSYFETGCVRYLRWLTLEGERPGMAMTIMESICYLWHEANEALEAQQQATERLSRFDRWGNNKGVAFIYPRAIHTEEE